jgi:DNA recombination protein RmuC
MGSSFAAVIAAIAGILVGFWLRGKSARAETGQSEMRVAELTRNLDAAKADITRLQADSVSRAGFEALATEREKALAGVREELQVKADSERMQGARIKELEAELRNEQKNVAEKIALLETAKQTLSNQFQTLATEILDSKSKTFSENSKVQLGTLLEPLKTQIKEFRDKVEQAQSDSKTGVAKLEGLIGSLGSLNQQLAEEARNLTTALRGSSKTQGDWGEFILRDLLEKAGLHEGHEYSFQQSFTGLDGEDGTKSRTARTDVIVTMPGGRKLIIDSKVSLTAYSDCVNATSDEARAIALKSHLASMRAHVSGLSKAEYHRLPGLDAPDFVVLFVPIEPAFLLALQNDGALWADAYKQDILLVGPTTLLYIIRIVTLLWHQERQERNVQKVMDRGAKLYEKFVGFVGDLEAVGKNLRSADQSYELAMNKLSGGRENLVRQVEMLKQLGLRTSKALPQNLVDAAADEDDEPLLALAAEADSNGNANIL